MTAVPPVAVQARSRRTQELIAEAAYALLMEGGVDALTMPALAVRAGVSVGSVYRRFGDKDRLLAAVQEGFAQTLRREVELGYDHGPTPADDAQPEQVIAFAVGAAVDAVMSRPRVLKVFLHLGVASPAVHDVGLRAVDQTGVRFARVLDGVPVSHPDRAAAIDFVFHLIDAELSYRLLHTADDDIDTLDWSDLRHRLTDVVIGYLLSPATASTRS
ncbi:TetR/AcrR family transcriptional regulator [Rhodococcus sp. BP-149]|jgi:AcrR family transcriptional regulator|uniref:TetR/AcrR family transcriptional regulator n=1 Tax=unclassified Rhodococcus (in: high G+C Gram-positive bacteria) TaxID=192944 RepID=UPI001C9B3E71|nr:MULTISPECIES: TetR/AcrR family transcriptional regulator [unclassified Rhodococcus (in: high G+C Gram-positive bacteria)]MBY6685656.1 TetR/AcrR family transcriptional regulator [Rhodococcus sp. BP-288]MBY6694796.1 TetR/AcrR family transcriptional regulator [Rhodococcus sp. BP-188]MBY6696642.1 TetR/AcrR family transcriptional regulator [Rhodococcus sp. BP-285]MBY6703298.1 TetR/AcrR family transcriptional regulator [Rhodococcus sp. BP-283]MBY6708621.1 TetR/AcrR family transcriptional regulato